MIRLSAACLNTSVRRTVGTTPLSPEASWLGGARRSRALYILHRPSRRFHVEFRGLRKFKRT
jgi:hypothetical protein